MADLPQLLTKVNKAEDCSNMSDLEKKHVPVIEAPDSVKAGEPFDVTVTVGKLLAHPNEAEHHIEWVDLYADYLFLARLDVAAVTTAPKATLSVCLTPEMVAGDGVLRAFEKCNMHGVWEGKKAIKVS